MAPRGQLGVHGEASHCVLAYGWPMFAVELSFSDHPARLELRPHHRELLTALHEAGELRDGGPFLDGSGAVLLLTTTRRRVDEVLAADPYYSAEGVSVVSIRELTSLFGN